MRLNITERAIINGKYVFSLAWKRARKLGAVPRYASATKIRQKILTIYIKAQTMNMRSRKKYEVDHVIPIFHPLVCGLHVPLNLQILDKDKNQAKSNYFTPYREKNGKKTYYGVAFNTPFHQKVPKKYNRTKKNPLKLAKKVSKRVVRRKK